MLDAFTTSKMIQHTQRELAHARGHKNWRTLFHSVRPHGGRYPYRREQ